MFTKRMITVAMATVAVSASVAMAGTKVQGNLVGANNGANPTVDGKSKFKFDGKGSYQIGLKGVTDSSGNPAAVTNGSTPDTEYIAVIKGRAAGVDWQFNVPFNITKEGQAKVKGSAGSLLTLTPSGTPIAVLGVEIHEPVPAMDAAACTAVLTGAIPGVALGANPCANGAIVGISGIVTE